MFCFVLCGSRHITFNCIQLVAKLDCSKNLNSGTLVFLFVFFLLKYPHEYLGLSYNVLFSESYIIWKVFHRVKKITVIPDTKRHLLYGTIYEFHRKKWLMREGNMDREVPRVHMKRKESVKPWGEDGHLQTTGRGLKRNQTCLYLDFGLLSSRIVDK